MTLLIPALARTMNVLVQVDLMTIDSGIGKLVITDGFIIDQTPPLPYNQNVIKTVSKALIKNRAGAYLLLYRGDSHPNFPGYLDIPGGEV